MLQTTLSNVPLILQTSRYPDGSLALHAVDYNHLPLAEISLNFPQVQLQSQEFILKTYSENHQFAQYLIDTGKISSPLRFISVDDRIFPVCSLI